MQQVDTSRRRLGAAALAAMLAAVTAWGAVEALSGGAALDAPEGAAAAAEALGSLLRPGDLVVVAPPLALLAESPLDAMPAVAAPAPTGLLAGRAARVFEVVLDGTEAPFAEPPDSFIPAEEQTGPGFALRRFDARDGGIGARLVDHVVQAQVALVPRSGATERCRALGGGRFSCGSEPWMHPGRVAARVSGALAPCIWAHPVEGKALRLTFPDVVLGAMVGGRMALVDGTGAGTDVEVTFTRDGEQLGRATLPGKPAGWKEILVRTPDRAGQKGELVVEIASKSARWRKVCLDPIIDGMEAP